MWFASAVATFGAACAATFAAVLYYTAALHYRWPHPQLRRAACSVAIMNIWIASTTDLMIGCNLIPDPVLMLAIILMRATPPVVRLWWVLPYHIVAVHAAFAAIPTLLARFAQSDVCRLCEAAGLTQAETAVLAQYAAPPPPPPQAVRRKQQRRGKRRGKRRRRA